MLIECGNGVRTNHEYDPLTFRLTHLHTLRGAERLQGLHYTYDPTGNITHIHDAAQQTIYFKNQVVSPSNDYTYDAAYRLIEAKGREHIGQASHPETTWDDQFRVQLPHPGDGQTMRRYTERYEYDGVGNFLKMIHLAPNGNWTRVYAYNEASLVETGKVNNRLSSTTVGSNPTEVYSHDAHGNMTSMPHLSLMQWDFKDQLQATSRQVVNEGTSETTYYVYDAAGQRVRKVTERQNGTRKSERTYLGGFEVFREYDGNGTGVTLERETLHVMDDKQRIALVETKTVDVALPLTPHSSLVRYQLGNHLGSASLELDSFGQIISYEEYYPYGSTSYQAGRSETETPKRYRFTGMERDEESMLGYHSARYYAPWLGQWLTIEPLLLFNRKRFALEDLKWEPYCYAFRNPLMYLDPNGEENIVVVGSEHREEEASKLQFVHQGIRSIKEYDSAEPHETRSMVLFRESYTKKQISAISNALKKHNADLIVVDSIEEFANYVNQGRPSSTSANPRDQDKVTNMDIFSHGVAGDISLGYHTIKEKQYSLNFSSLKMFAPEAFDRESTITSYACRTAWSSKDKYKEERSLAREMAITLQTDVRAFATRSDYEDTLGSSRDRAFLSFEVYGELNKSLKRRKGVDGAIFDPEGAIRPVKPGSPDRGRPEGFVYFDQSGMHDVLPWIWWSTPDWTRYPDELNPR